LSWDEAEAEASASVDCEDRSAQSREPTPLPQAESRAEVMLEEATLVEGMDSVDYSICHIE
jgi:hypothetical protein